MAGVMGQFHRGTAAASSSECSFSEASINSNRPVSGRMPASCAAHAGSSGRERGMDITGPENELVESVGGGSEMQGSQSLPKCKESK